MTTKEIVIIGGGIIGCTTAFYLSQHSSSTITSESSTSAANTLKITLIEASIHGPAQGASGKAGGLVARWAYPKELSTLSFNEHVKLAEEHGGKEKWGWRYVNCGSWEGRGEASEADKDTDVNSGGISLEKTLGLPGGQKPNPRKAATTKKRLPDDLNWIPESLTDAYSPMAPSGHTAQVHPYLFTTAMLELAQQRGVKHIQGRATRIVQYDGRVTGVEYASTIGGTTQTQTTQIPATHVIVAAGAWSPVITPTLPIAATRAHSLVIRPAAGVEIAPYVLFTEITEGPTAGSSPEIYARPDGTVYACGTGDNEPLPEGGVDDVIVDGAACDAIYAHVSSISRELRVGTVEKRQACYLPSVNVGGSGGPIVGEVRQIAKGLYIGTGHTCWGISNAPGTAKALTELIMNGKITSANLKRLDPTVFL